ncbi:hypothetical protein BS50DRAFT_671344 [Corynespora cassiicola Philippines]|uniref:Aminoglycoside phosphotransferase domain-containing protein n=1 Tax=Corynespora cassiicola Philippines TaxID=1448308 RepID=A0A2T2PBS5_CORCC|nr:hypothetical protein BS50DRAFT_671344 [Corynespora cassiicola Philippines]
MMKSISIETPRFYAMESSIAEFFATSTGTTRKQCDEMAMSFFKGPFSPVPIQGCFSYTVVGSSPAKLLQFRVPDSDFDIEILKLAQLIHGKLVANTVGHGSIGSSPPLFVYAIDLLPGLTYAEARLAVGDLAKLSPTQYRRQRNTVVDLAKFFAAAWNHPQTADLEPIKEKFTTKLQLLASHLPPRFCPLVHETLHNLPLLFSSSYPSVLTHADFSETNILIDPATGHLTGVIDWAEASILPFGCASWGMKNLLGFMHRGDWQYFSQGAELEELFWYTFERTVDSEIANGNRESIRTAGVVGILLRFGFRWGEGLEEIVVDDDDERIKYLDAFLMRS